MRDSLIRDVVRDFIRDILIRRLRIAAALAMIGVAATATTALAQQMPPGTPQTPAAAPQQPSANDRALSITPFMVMGDDLAAGAGMSVQFPLTGRFSLEAEAMADRDAMRTGLSLLVNVKRLGRFSTYLAGGAGVQRDESRGLVPDAPWPMYSKKTEFAIGIGGGTTIPLGTRWSYRADFRWYNPRLEWPESWRISNGLTLHLAPR